MRFSRRGCYSLRAMIELARRFQEGPVQMSMISEKHDISRKYLHALLTALKSAGLVRSVRGSGGGYVLSRPPSEITLGEVVQVLEGSFALVECVDDENLCGKSESCMTRDVWWDISKVIERMLGEVSIEDLANRQIANENPSPF